MSAEQEDRDVITLLTFKIKTRTETAKSLKKLVKMAKIHHRDIFHELETYTVVKDCQESPEDKVRERATKLLALFEEPKNADTNNNEHRKLHDGRFSKLGESQGQVSVPSTPSPLILGDVMGQSNLKWNRGPKTASKSEESQATRMPNICSKKNGEFETRRERIEKDERHMKKKQTSEGSSNSVSFSSGSPTLSQYPHHTTSNQVSKKRPASGGLELNEEMIKPRKERMKVFSGTKKSSEPNDSTYNLVLSNHSFPTDSRFKVVYPHVCKLSAEELIQFLKPNPHFNAKADHLFKKFLEAEFPNSNDQLHSGTYQQKYIYEKELKKEMANEQLQARIDKFKQKRNAESRAAIMLDSIPKLHVTNTVKRVGGHIVPPPAVNNPRDRSRGNPIRPIGSAKQKMAPNMAKVRRQIKKMQRR